MNGPSTTVAMIVLYVVTGCVSFLFCIIIISGVRKYSWLYKWETNFYVGNQDHTES
ncbi:hypothetical protein K438DRAFT_1809435 [Mycena galopus ATCC 62051]|nr:hypothetical protein K438DRAFT_1809435 [Mycena galopus ATCC 62051]